MFRRSLLLSDAAGRLRARRSWWRRRPSRLVAGAAVTALLLGGLATEVYGSSHPSVMVVHVKPGDTVWKIAAATYDPSDVRDRVDQIVTANDLTGRSLMAGQSLAIPAP